MPTTPKLTAVCAYCGTAFAAHRTTARYCRDTCRKRALRGIPAHQRLALPRGDVKRWKT